MPKCLELKIRVVVVVSVLLMLAGCASPGRAVDDDETEQDAAVALPDADNAEPDEEAKEPLLDRTQQSVFGIVNTSAKWFDGFFGATEVDREQNVSRGRLNVGAFWDERDGVRQRVRMSARLPLPAAKRRARLVFGRGDVDDLVDGSQGGDVDSLPDRFNDFEDDDWLLGIGYSRHGEVAKGWDFGAGVRLNTPLEPYVRATYRWNRNVGDAGLWRVQPRVFWQSQRGVGASLTNILDYAVSTRWLLRSWTILRGEDEIEGLGWTQQFTAYQALSNKDALSYSMFATGETQNDVPVLDYGIELRYRKKIAREWLFAIFSTRLNWPREFPVETREKNFGVGIEFEMQFGDWPGRRQSAESSASFDDLPECPRGDC